MFTKKTSASAMWSRGCGSIHNGDVGENDGLMDYRIRVTKKFGKCLNRQMNEDIRMQKFFSEGGTLLNSKNE